MSIKFENTEVMNFEGAIRGMRNPLNSWCLSDSDWCWEHDHNLCADKLFNSVCCDDGETNIYCIGENDLNLMKRLINAGNDHRKFMRQILVSVDITAPLYWWKEFDTYKVGTVANSCSTMHKIHEKEFTLDDFSYEHLVDQEEHADADCIGSWKTFFTSDSFVPAFGSSQYLALSVSQRLWDFIPRFAKLEQGPEAPSLTPGSGWQKPVQGTGCSRQRIFTGGN